MVENVVSLHEDNEENPTQNPTPSKPTTSLTSAIVHPQCLDLYETLNPKL